MQAMVQNSTAQYEGERGLANKHKQAVGVSIAAMQGIWKKQVFMTLEQMWKSMKGLQACYNINRLLKIMDIMTDIN